MLEELRRQQEETKARILKSFGDDDPEAIQKSEEGDSLNDLIRKGEVEVDDALEKALKQINSQYGTNYSLDDFEHDRPTRYSENSYSIEIGKNGGKSGGSGSGGGSGKLMKIDSASSAAKFLKENAEKYMDYQYGDDDMDENTRKNFDAASKYVKMGKTFTAGSQEALDYEEKMGKKGYRVIDLTSGSGNQSTYALIKKNGGK